MRPAARRLGAFVVGVTAISLSASCTVGPSARAPLATYGQPPAAGTTTATARSLPTGPGGPGQQAEPLDWGRCSDDVPTRAGGAVFTVRCATLTVPSEYSDPTAPTLQLAVASAAGADTPADAPPLVVVLDDPGVHGRDDVAQVAAELPRTVVDGHTIVTMDLRGAGTSGISRMDCFEPETVTELLIPPVDPTDDAAAEQIHELSRAATFNCNDEIGPIISEFGSTAAADDLDSLRSALRTERLQFLGRGFGATLGAVYADRYPGRVQRMVLDSPTDPHASPTDLATQRGVELETALDDFAADCAARDCPLGADPKGAVTDLVADLGDTGGPAGNLLITGGSVLLLLSRQLAHPDRWPELASALAAARDRDDYEPIVDLLIAQLGLDGDHGLLEPRLAYACNDSGQRLTGDSLVSAARTAEQKAPVFGAFLVGLAGLCSAWPTATSPLGRVSGTGAPPILVAGATGDPISPYQGVKAVVSQLSSAQLISWQSGANGAVPASSCVTEAVGAYLTDGTLPPAGRLCPP